MLKQSLLALFTSSLCLAACGGGDGGGSGVDGSKTLTTLTDEEIIDICEYSESRISVSTETRLNCYIEGIFGAQEGGDCETIYSECSAAYQVEPSECATAPDEDLPACASMITVGDIEDCFDAQASAVNAISISCATTAEELETLFEMPLPQECQAIDETCPDIL